MESENENGKAYIQNQLLREGLSESILNLIEAKGLIYGSVKVTATRQQNNDTAIEELTNSIRTCTNQERLSYLEEQLKEEEEKARNGIIKQIIFDEEAYGFFIEAFYVSWTAFKTQITKWPREETIVKDKQIIELSTPDHIEWLFNSRFDGGFHPRIALELCDEFIQSLKLSGLFDMSIKELPTE